MIWPTRWLLRALTVSIACGLAASSALRAAEEAGWLIDLKAMPGYHSNYFFRGEGAEAPDTTLFSLYGLGEREIEAGRGDFTFSFNVGAVFVQDVEDADYYDINLGGDYKLGPNKVSAELFTRPNQVFEEEGAGVFFDITGIELGVRHSLARGFWIGAEYELESWDFDPVEDDRDATAQAFSLSVRWPLDERYGVRLTGLYEQKDADDDQYSQSGPGASIALEAQPSDRTELFVRYKYRERDYDDAPAGTNNFGRQDEVQDIVFNLTYELARRWALRLENFYRDGSSTRPDRNYDGNRIYVGAVYHLRKAAG